MPTVMVIFNIVFIAGVVVGILGLLAWGIITDRPFATYLTDRTVARASAGGAPARRRTRSPASGPAVGRSTSRRAATARHRNPAWAVSLDVGRPERCSGLAQPPPRRSAPDVPVQGSLRLVLAGVNGDDPARPVDEDRRRRPEQALRHDPGELGRAHLIAGVAHRVLGQEGPRVARVVVDVGPEKRDMPTVFGRGGGEQAELGAAGRAPRAPRVEHDRVAAQAADPDGQRRLACEQLIGLGMNRRQRSRRACQLRLDGGRGGRSLRRAGQGVSNLALERRATEPARR